MDSGYLAPGDTLEDEYDIRRDLLPEEVIGIIDQLMCHEVSMLLSFVALGLMKVRWRGILDILCHRQYLPVYTLIVYWNLNRRISKLLGLMVLPVAIRKSLWDIRL